ncbi:MAG: DUF2933 domain-containing protein [Alphaproteobacteria bacterium]|nr:DUF2933 domain-containing protein [Alphaproteobacteria bacterium]
MQHDHGSQQDPHRGGFLLSPAGLALVAFLGVAGYFLWTEHRAHVVQYLPWILLLACPLLHVFMHGGHGGHGGGKSDDRRGNAP